ncbi:hypothetical protein BJ166DRAFT_295339 [Pestalotiopsis sp. NC0098]|nr:hypothetical protein BJ166DRAFT_295339 [Pestalotiopsis sp. NC0098]
MSTEDTSPLDYSDDGPAILISCAVLGFVTTVVVGCRFWSRKLVGTQWGLDDWLTFASLLAHHAVVVACGFMVVKGGLGRDIRVIVAEEPEDITELYKALLAAEVFYIISSSLVKLSLLAFYRRIFPTPRVKLGCQIIGGLTIGWAISCQIVNLLQCIPLKAFWEVALRADSGTKCLDPILFFLSNSAVNVVIDFATLILPIQEILKLHTSKSKKWGIAGVFLLGGMAFTASLLRTIFTGTMYNEGTNNFTKQFVVSAIATIVEIYVALISGCLPALVPVYRRLRYNNALKTTTITCSEDRYFSNTGGGTATVLKSSSRPKIKTSEMGGEGSFERLATGKDQFAMNELSGSRSVNVSSTMKYDSDDNSSETREGIVVRSELSWQESKTH